MDDRSNDSLAPDASPRTARFAPAEAGAAASLQRVGTMVEIPRILREMNVDPAQLFASLGLDESALSDIEGRLSFPVVSALILKCIEATARADFSLLVGAAARLSHLGIIGKLLGAAPNLGTALEDFAANHPRYVRGASTYLMDLGKDGVVVGHRVHQASLHGAAAFSAGAIAFGRAVFAELCGVEPVRVLLPVPRPEDVAPYRRAFGEAELVFEAEHFGLAYSRAALATPIPTADASVRAEIRKFVAERWNFLQPDIQDRVMRVLVPFVLGGTPSLKSTAALLLMHPRTLNRALQARQTSFREALNAARFEIAAQLLRDTRIPIRDVAQLLGYSQVSAFTRFFTEMADLPPSEWRERELAAGLAKQVA